MYNDLPQHWTLAESGSRVKELKEWMRGVINVVIDAEMVIRVCNQA